MHPFVCVGLNFNPTNQLLLIADACLEEVKMASAYDNSSSQKKDWKWNDYGFFFIS